MIRFDKITYKNILSVGQAPLTMSLSTHRLTALNGPSGSGKSLFLDALSFSLFGRAFRDINKTDLINTINGKGLLVELEFSIGSDNYKIVRGLKPTVFQIIVNGSPLNQDSHSKDQQKYLEDQILKMNWKMFTHVVMLGAANYTPFMRLKPSERKKMVENILGIDVFSTMNGLLKTKISDETLRYKSTVEKRDSIVKQVDYLEQQQKAFEERVKEEIKALTGKLSLVRDNKKSIDLEVVELEQQIEIMVQSFDPKIDVPVFNEKFEQTFDEVFDEEFNETFDETEQSAIDPAELASRKATKVAESKSIKEKLAQVKSQVEFYKEHDSCPTCSQSIEEQFRANAILSLALEIGDIEGSVKLVDVEIAEIKAEAEKMQARLAEYNQRAKEYKTRKAAFEKRRYDFESRRRSFEQSLRAFESKRREHEEKLKKTQLLIEQKRKQFDSLIDTKKDALNEKRTQAAALIAEAKIIFESIEEKKAKPLLDNTQEIARLNHDVKSLSDEIDRCANNVRLFRDAQAIIKDDGVKSEILKRYVPTLNKYINKYLTRMGMFVSFELDQEFNDTIRSRHRDVLSYANYSEGERQRLDLAVLLAWRHLAQAQSAVNTNLLVLDEVLDSYLDQNTTEAILSLMKGDEFQAFNIIIISHKEGLTESFDRTLHFQKKNNFTAIDS